MKKLNVIFMSLVVAMATSGLQAAKTQLNDGVTKAIFSTLVAESGEKVITESLNTGYVRSVRKGSGLFHDINAHKVAQQKDTVIVNVQYLLPDHSSVAQFAYLVGLYSSRIFAILEKKEKVMLEENHRATCFLTESDSQYPIASCHWVGTVDEFLKNFADLANEKK